MKLSELQVGTEYAIFPAWEYNSKNSRDVNTVRESDVLKATVLELTKFEYDPNSRTQDRTQFKKAPEGHRSVGVLVTAKDKNGNDFYWTARLADILIEWATLEPLWANRNQAEQEARRIEEEKRRKVRELQARVQEEVARSKTSILTSLSELVGNAEVSVDTTGYEESYKGVVTVGIKEFERLLELAYEGKAVL
jgi:hypothetical protein